MDYKKSITNGGSWQGFVKIWGWWNVTNFHTLLFCIISLESILWLCQSWTVFPHSSPWHFVCLQWLREGLSKLFRSMEKEDMKVLNKGEEEEMVCLSVILHLRHCVSLCFPTYRTAPPFLLPPFRSCRATVCVVGGWPWWALVCCVQGASSSCCSTGCQSGASNPPALVPQPVMPK